MIGKVTRGSDVAGLLRYLFGPGRANEHTDPHLVAAWDGDAPRHEPAKRNGRHDVRRLAGLLQQPLAASLGRPTDRPVWHCSVRAAPGDRRLSDDEWAQVAADVVAATGLARADDDGGCRWVAVRHADDHIHIVVTLARQDGRRARLSNDFYRVGEACRAAEQRLGLRRTAPRDRTAAKRPTRAEREKAARHGRSEPVRATLRREVRAAAARAAGPDDFLAQLTMAGLLVRQRHSDEHPGVVTGHAVALPGDRASDGQPVWFGGGRLAADLSWPRLAAKWHTASGQPRRVTTSGGRVRLSGQQRQEAWLRCAALAEAAAGDVARLAARHPRQAADVADAAGDALAVAARLVEGRRGGPLTEASEAYDRAAREIRARPLRTPAGRGLRSAARLLALTGRAMDDETTQVIALLHGLADLAQAVADLRDAQHRTAQAAAAREAAVQLRNVAAHRRPRQPTTAPPRQRQPAVIPSRLDRPVVHRSPRRTA